MSSGPRNAASTIAFDAHTPPVRGSVEYRDLISELFFEVDSRTTGIAPVAKASGVVVDDLHKVSVIGGYVALVAGFFGTVTFLLSHLA